MDVLIYLINLLARIITLLVLAQAIMSYFVSPYHPVRQALDRLLEPLYTPIRRFLPQTGMIDFSPLVLIILVQIIAWLLVSILVSF
ncbi:MAG: YggT family protein [Anaerolineales bacterium]